MSYIEEDLGFESRRKTREQRIRERIAHMGGKDPKKVLEEEDKHEEERQRTQHPEMIGFDLPCRVCLLGGTGAGKTHTFVHKMLLDERCMKGKFRRIVCFSPTMMRDPEWRKIFTASKGFVHYDMYDDNIMHTIYKEQEWIFENARDLAEPILVYIDDNAYNTREGSNHEWLDRTYVSGRHLDISIVCCVQKKHMLSPVQFEQISNLLIWCTASQKSIDSVHEQMGAMLDKRQFQQIFADITQEEFAFMHLRKKKVGGTMQIWKGIQDECVIDNVNSITAIQKSQKLSNTYGQNYNNMQGPQNPNQIQLKTASQ